MEQQLNSSTQYHSSNTNTIDLVIPYNESIKFVDKDQTLVFDPQNDMLPIESVRICQLFLLCSFKKFDAFKFIINHNLFRHFKKDT